MLASIPPKLSYSTIFLLASILNYIMYQDLNLVVEAFHQTDGVRPLFSCIPSILSMPILPTCSLTHILRSGKMSELY